MASYFLCTSIILLQSCTFLTILQASIDAQVQACYTSLFAFGDSVTDTGNLLLYPLPNHVPHMGLPPYGETYFHHPAGRCSDGRLMIDFLAEHFGLPLLPPSGAVVKANITVEDFFAGGANFAIAGSPALDIEFYMERGIPNDSTNITLRNQIDMFKAVLSSFCGTPYGCKRQLQSSLVCLGPFGGNDYTQPFAAGKSIDYVLPFVPLVVKAIGHATKQLLEVGVSTIIVPGNWPIGCLSSFLAIFKTSNSSEYDSNGCHIRLNQLIIYHNRKLQEELDRLRQYYPHARIIYADYYNAAMQIYNSPRRYGFTAWPLRACCGTGGTYNFNYSLGRCGDPIAKVCENPSLYVNWDGYHMTEAANRVILNGVVERHSFPLIASSCLSSTTKTTSSKAQ